MAGKIELNNMSDLIEKSFRESGIRLTNTRRNILDLLLRARSELTADELYILSHNKNPKIGIATVYRTIRLFEKLGYLNKIFDENKKSFRYKFKYGNNLTLALTMHQAHRLKESINPKEVFVDSNLDEKQNIYNFADIKEDMNSFGKIRKMQDQLYAWMNDINRIKKEKELELEDMIKDFGEIDKVIEKHNYSSGNLIQMLIDFQSEFNWLPKHVLFYVSNKLNIPLTNIYNIATFYKSLNLEPRGKYSIVVCAGTACHVRGSVNLLQRIVNILGIKPGDTTDDYKFTLDTVNCLGCCALGPVMVLNERYYSNPSTRQLEKLFSEF
ncbi:MAG: NAD(P)H-dependent oxidoreductase subunit E [Candidatus Humimicrobiaceae bacterium]